MVPFKLAITGSVESRFNERTERSEIKTFDNFNVTVPGIFPATGQIIRTYMAVKELQFVMTQTLSSY